MATTTTNYGLTLPGYSDTADIEDINDNMEAIDNALDAKDRSLAVVNTGDTAEANIAKGELVYVRGHTTLADGLYQASEAITSGASLSGSNLTSTSVSDQITNLGGTVLYGKRVTASSSKATHTIKIPNKFNGLILNNHGNQSTRVFMLLVYGDNKIVELNKGSNITSITRTDANTITVVFSDAQTLDCDFWTLDKTGIDGIYFT